MIFKCVPSKYAFNVHLLQVQISFILPYSSCAKQL